MAANDHPIRGGTGLRSGDAAAAACLSRDPPAVVELGVVDIDGARFGGHVECSHGDLVGPRRCNSTFTSWIRDLARISVTPFGC